MSSSLKNFLTNDKISISNSIILNNYSIQNVIISPTNIIDSRKKFPIKSEKYFQMKSDKNNFPSTPRKSKAFINIHPSTFYKYATPIPSKKSFSKFVKIKNIYNENSNFHTNNNIVNPKIIPFLKEEISEEKHPQDSIRKLSNKKKFIGARNLKFQKNLLINSLSQRALTESKIQNRVLNTLSLENKINKEYIKLKQRNFKTNNNSPRNSKIEYIEPKNNFNLNEFQFKEQIGKGTFGNIFCVKWIKNNKLYAMKKETFYDLEDIKNRKRTFNIISNFINSNENIKGISYLYGNLCLKKKKVNNNILDSNQNYNNNINEYLYYELMEKAERDWDNEINERSIKRNYYSENEIINIMTQLIGILSLMQRNHITHRDIKPQNILILNGNYKLCDFGEIRLLERAGLIVQRVRGSELYMSPILFKGLHANLIQVKHNTYKSDVFSLGMCLFYACSLTYSGVDSIREINDMEKIKEILFQYLGNKYSPKLILFILSMLEVDENKRFHFIQLEEKLKTLYK